MSRQETGQAHTIPKLIMLPAGVLSRWQSAGPSKKWPILGINRCFAFKPLLFSVSLDQRLT